MFEQEPATTGSFAKYARRSDSQYGSFEQSASDGSVDRQTDVPYLEPRPSFPTSSSLPSRRNQQRLGVNGTSYRVQMRMSDSKLKHNSVSTPVMTVATTQHSSDESDADTCAGSQSSATDTNSQLGDSTDLVFTSIPDNSAPNSYCMTLPTNHAPPIVTPRRRGASTSSTGARGPPAIAPKPRMSISRTEQAHLPGFCSIARGPERLPPQQPIKSDVNTADCIQHNTLRSDSVSDDYSDALYSPTSPSAQLIRHQPPRADTCSCVCHVRTAVTSRGRWQRNKSAYSSSSSAQPLLSNSSADTGSCTCACRGGDVMRSPARPQVLFSSDKAECVVVT